MALFGGKEKKKAAEDLVMQKLAQHKLLTGLMQQVLIQAGKASYIDDNGEECIEKRNSWLTECQSYYDSRRRTVTIAPDLFEIKWSDTHQEQHKSADGKTYYESAEDIHGKIAYAYTSSGYRPLHSFSNGEAVVDVSVVLSCWAEIIKEKMQEMFPEMDFSRVVSREDKAFFTYDVPELEWKDWF